ncbi:MAG: mucoidy inhibitor MuiA family protein, partial [Chloroflexia bacterium]
MPTIETRISDVTVYVDRARIVRKGSIHLAAGEQTITIEKLPTTLQDDSVRAAGRGAGVRILGVEVARDYYTETPEENQAALQKQLQEIQDNDAALADADTAQAARLEFLKNLANSSTNTLPRGIAYGKADINSVVTFSKYITDEMEAAQTKRREIAQQRRDLAREIEVVQSKLQPQYSSIERIRINVIVEAAAETDLELEVTYSVIGASWSPLYDIRLVEDKVSVGYLANVQQTTGEDWPEVQLALSTARPAVSTTIPELDPWYLDVYRPPMPKMMRSAAPA